MKVDIGDLATFLNKNPKWLLRLYDRLGSIRLRDELLGMVWEMEPLFDMKMISLINFVSIPSVQYMRSRGLAPTTSVTTTTGCPLYTKSDIDRYYENHRISETYKLFFKQNKTYESMVNELLERLLALEVI